LGKSWRYGNYFCDLPKNSIFLAGKPPPLPPPPLSTGTDKVCGRTRAKGRDWGRDRGSVGSEHDMAKELGLVTTRLSGRDGEDKES
jgi:hypothetical protein